MGCCKDPSTLEKGRSVLIRVGKKKQQTNTEKGENTLQLKEYATAKEKSLGGVGSKELHLQKLGCWRFP